MNIFTVSFFGHRQIADYVNIERKLERVVRHFITSNEYVEFLVGRDGEFDRLVASTVRRCKRSDREDNAALILVLPYMTAEYRNNIQSFQVYYDEVEICEASAEEYFKSAHQARNRSMFDRSDIVVFCVDHCFGGAYKTLRYAEKTGASFINLFDKNE